MIFNILDNTTELWMTKYIIGEIFSSGGATLYRNPSDQTVCSKLKKTKIQLQWKFPKAWKTYRTFYVLVIFSLAGSLNFIDDESNKNWYICHNVKSWWWWRQPSLRITSDHHIREIEYSRRDSLPLQHSKNVPFF